MLSFTFDLLFEKKIGIFQAFSFSKVEFNKSILLKEGDLLVGLSSYAFRRALTDGADIWQVGMGRQPEVC